MAKLSEAECCLLNCLGLSQMLIEAAQAGQLSRMHKLQQRWQREVASCVEVIRAQEDLSVVEAQLMRLLADVEEKSRVLEQVIGQLQAQQRKALQQLRQAESYLSRP